MRTPNNKGLSPKVFEILSITHFNDVVRPQIMNITNLIKFILMIILYSSTSYSEPLNMPNSLLHFNAIIGTGTLEQTLLNKGVSSVSASLSTLEKFAIDNETVCQALFLKTNKELVVIVASCESGKFYICPNGKESCITEPFDPTLQKGRNKLEMHSQLFNTKYVVEFYADRFIYRIQEKSCFIKYPHGCLIHGFSWKDEYTYEFSKH